MQPIQQKASLTEQVSTMIRAAIVAGEMAPGEHYSAIGISEKLGVSRTPVREALQLLEKEGIVTVAKNRQPDFPGRDCRSLPAAAGH